VQDLDKTYGNPDLKSQRAVHYTAGFEKDFREGSASGWSLSNDFFYKHVYDLVARTTAMINPSRPQYYDNSGYGHIYGLEFMGKYKSPQWQGWVAYTLSRSRRGDALTQETISQYDQTHLLTAVAERELGRNWKLSARVRYTTGNPFTPIVGASYDVNNDVYDPIRGDIYSQRMGAFSQADVRVDKKWVLDRLILTGYLDVENITNQKNSQEIRYSYSYQQSEKVTGLPIYPTLGIKAEF
jgi:outer membrane receptor protein involved in Fe transport